MDAKKLNNISITEYLEIERSTKTRHEYHDGTIVALAGGSVEHGLISGNTFGEIKIGLRNKKNNCRVLNSEIKLFIQSTNKYVYPDVMAICGDIEKTDREIEAVVNPIVIIEVLSKSTESYDRGDKFFFYRQIESLQEYILIDQYQPQVDIYKRQSDLWEIKRIEGLDQQFEIPSLGIVIDMKNIYEDIVFPK
jgi:Uma2 family endonuclease